jgi:pimeloyl-ACP methyl ester carboxylesterase
MPPILLIHGAFSQGRHFDAWSDFFRRAGFECHAPSLPGHAPSDESALAALTMHDYLAALRGELARFTAPPIIIGHSMGGLLAQQLAASGPCAGLVLVASAPPWMLPVQLQALPTLFKHFPTILRGRPVRPTERILRELALHDLPEDEQRALIPIFVPESGKAYRAMVLGLARIPGRQFAGPVLCLSGGLDRIIPERTSHAIAREYHARHQRFAHCGHWLIAPSREREVAGAVLQWLKDIRLATD